MNWERWVQFCKKQRKIQNQQITLSLSVAIKLSLLSSDPISSISLCCVSSILGIWMKFLVILVQMFFPVLPQLGDKNYLVKSGGEHYLVEVARNASSSKESSRNIKDKENKGLNKGQDYIIQSNSKGQDFTHTLEYCRGMEALCKNRSTCIEPLNCWRW